MEEAAKLFDMKVLHVGINATGEEQALGWAEEFLKFFDLPTKNGNSSVFAGTLVEIMKGNGRGTVGHIAFGVNDVDKAVEYFKERGANPIEETRKVVDCKTTFVYLDKEIAGFAIHLNLVK